MCVHLCLCVSVSMCPCVHVCVCDCVCVSLFSSAMFELAQFNVLAHSFLSFAQFNVLACSVSLVFTFLGAVKIYDMQT